MVHSVNMALTLSDVHIATNLFTVLACIVVCACDRPASETSR